MKLRFNFIFFILIFLSFLFACSQRKQEVCSDQVILQLNWTDDPTFTGEYVAKEKFWFLKKLDVTIKQGGIGIDPIAMVLSKKAHFAVVGADKALVAISDQKPIQIISVDLQRNPVGWICRPELKILNFDDVRDREDVVLGDKAGTEISAILELVLKKKQLNIKPKPVSFDFSYFLANKNVVYPVYLNEEPVKAEVVHGVKVNELDPSLEINGGIKLYGNVLIAHKDMIRDCSTQVQKFKSGLKSGWKYASEDRDEALLIVLKYVKNDKEYVRQTMNRTVDFATNMYGIPVPPGHMEYGAWESTVQVLKETGLLKTNIDLKEAIYIK